MQVDKQLTEQGSTASYMTERSRDKVLSVSTPCSADYWFGWVCVSPKPATTMGRKGQSLLALRALIRDALRSGLSIVCPKHPADMILTG